MHCPFYLALFKTFHAQRNENRKHTKDVGLSPGQPKILNYLVQHDFCTQNELAVFCEVDKATISSLIINLEKNKLVKKIKKEEDKRVCYISITKKGRKKQQEFHQLCLEVEQISLHGFSEIEREQFYQYLERMYFNLTSKPL